MAFGTGLHNLHIVRSRRWSKPATCHDFQQLKTLCNYGTENVVFKGARLLVALRVPESAGPFFAREQADERIRTPFILPVLYRVVEINYCGTQMDGTLRRALFALPVQLGMR